MRLAAIDVGSNSVHMVIAELGPAGDLEVVDRVKEMVRLGRRSFVTGLLSEKSMNLAVRALKNFYRLARVRRVNRLRAVATSAVREARNRGAFVRRIKRETGLRVEIISGAEEARLIFNAARHAFGLEGGPHLLVDVGGGSVELVLVHDGKPLWLESVPLGVARLAERFFADDPPTHAQVHRLEQHLEKVLHDVMKRARRAGVVDAIGTSGSVNTLVAMARASRGEDLARLHGASASVPEVARLRRKMLGLPAAARVEMPGMDAKRADLMPVAGVLLDFILSRSGARQLIACSWALREGVLLSLARRAREMSASQTRRSSVNALATRFAGANLHGRHVARLSLKLFEATASMLGLPAESRELLEYAALLHDIGHVIDHDRHNRHSYYLIKNAEMFGFKLAEIEVIAQAARSHRKQASKADSSELRLLGPRQRKVARGLAAILRVADALDRSHFGVVKNLKVNCTPGRLSVAVSSQPGKADLELWTSERRIDLLSRLLSRQVTVHC